MRADVKNEGRVKCRHAIFCKLHKFGDDKESSKGCIPEKRAGHRQSSDGNILLLEYIAPVSGGWEGSPAQLWSCL